MMKVLLVSLLALASGVDEAARERRGHGGMQPVFAVGNRGDVLTAVEKKKMAAKKHMEAKKLRNPDEKRLLEEDYLPSVLPEESEMKSWWSKEKFFEAASTTTDIRRMRDLMKKRILQDPLVRVS